MSFSLRILSYLQINLSHEWKNPWSFFNVKIYTGVSFLLTACATPTFHPGTRRKDLMDKNKAHGI